MEAIVGHNMLLKPRSKQAAGHLRVPETRGERYYTIGLFAPENHLHP